MGNKNILRGILLAFLVSVTHADVLTLNPNAPERYVVVKGDTLWDIAEKFLQNPWYWPEIWQVNPEIENPHLIYPGDTLYLTYGADGRPRITVQRGKPVVKLSPQARAVAKEEAIPTIPLDQIQQFLTRARVMSKEEYERLGYIVAFREEHLIAANEDKAYVRGLSDESQRQYTVVRLGDPYRNPGDNEILGYEVLEVADAKLDQFGDPSSVILTNANREVLNGDRMLSLEDPELRDSYLPHPAPLNSEGLIISVLDGVSRIGQYHVVVLNVGEQDGIETGHVFEVYQSGRTVKDTMASRRGESVTLPDEKAGVVMVFRTFSRVSYALVMRATRDIRIYDKVKAP